MYVECDFLLALIKDDDWLGEPAERVYRDHQEELWTSAYTLLELMLVARRENRDVVETLVSVRRLVEVRGGAEETIAAASYVEEREMTPFDAIHLVQSGKETIVSSGDSYDEFSPRLELEDA